MAELLVMLDEQLVQGVGRHAGLGGQYFGCGCGGRNPECWAALGLEVGDGGGECRGLAGTGGTDDQLQGSMAGDRSRRLPLCWGELLAVAGCPRRVQTAPVWRRSAHGISCSSSSRIAWVVSARSTAASLIGLPSCRSDHTGRDGSGDVDTAGGGRMVGESLQEVGQLRGVDGDGGGYGGGQFSDQLGWPPC